MQTLHRFPERPDPLLTIVVPCFQEEETIPEFHQRITRVVKRLPVSCEILYVDDGSNDRIEFGPIDYLLRLIDFAFR